MGRNSKCTVFRESCPVHGYYHGGEAKELREGIEKVIRMAENFNDNETDSISELQSFPDDIIRRLAELLRSVDARDSLAREEADEEDDLEDAKTQVHSVRGLDFPCENCGKQVGSVIESGVYHCIVCGYPE